MANKDKCANIPDSKQILNTFESDYTTYLYYQFIYLSVYRS